MPDRKQDSNVTGLAFAEETDLKVLPGVLGADAVWYEMEPNTYNDFGSEISMVARSPINASRQRKRGSVTGFDASGGLNQDFTQNNMTRMLQGFFFAAAREKATTLPLNGAQILFTSVDDAPDDYIAAAGLGIFRVGDLLLAENFGVAANNGLSRITAASGTNLTVADRPLTAEAAPPADASLRVVGFQFAAGDASLVAAAGSLTLATVAKDLTQLGLNVGEWVFLGDDSNAAYMYALNTPGYARVASIAANAIVFDDTTWTPATDAGAAKTIRIYFGTVLRNEDDPALIERRSYSIERQLGSDDDGVQSEYLDGSIPNELTLNMPQEDKLNVDLTYVAMDAVYRTGAEGLRDGDRVSSPGEEAINTSSDIYRIKMHVHDAASTNPAALFGYVSEGNLSINNGVKPTKALGVVGAFDASAGDFEVGGSVTAYFSTIEAVQAVRDNADVGFSVIFAQRNAGIAFDIPLLTLGGGRLDVTKDEPIMVPLETAAAENDAGYTLMLCTFQYLPDAAMPD